MNEQYPIYTVQTECHDCYKCVRACPVKAIRIENGVASVLPERCIACGRCVRVCPSRAKRVRDDLPRLKTLLASGADVYVSLAPSWAGVFRDWSKPAMIAALKKLGFAEVSETALGAQEVSAAVAEQLADKTDGVWLSSACPAAVDYVRLYHPESAGRIVPVASPALTHCALLRQKFGENIKTVFIGPCAAKKNEADRHPELMTLALTFDELTRLLAERDLSPEMFADSVERFVPEPAAEGGLYPMEGGMLETIRRCAPDSPLQLQAISGVPLLAESLERMEHFKPKFPVFVETLACGGGCVNGPCGERLSELAANAAVLENTVVREPAPRLPSVRVPMEYAPSPVAPDVWDESKIREAMERVGKTRPEDELNCGGCGYDTCRHFAEALLRGDAEPSQCVSYMRKTAMRKANALLRCMPSGVAILDADLSIVESNRSFARILGGDLPDLFDDVPGLSGADIRKILPSAVPLFQAALERGEDIHKEHFPVGDTLLDLTIFSIAPGKTIGVMIEDVTRTEMRRDEIAQKAQEVISRNITIVQDIACRLGEHMADTEILLNSIAEGYRRAGTSASDARKPDPEA